MRQAGEGRLNVISPTASVPQDSVKTQAIENSPKTSRNVSTSLPNVAFPQDSSSDTEIESSEDEAEDSTIVLIQGETSDITSFSKISLVREIGEIIKDFRVTKNRPNKELEVKVSDNDCAETLKTKRTLCNIDIKTIIKTPS